MKTESVMIRMDKTMKEAITSIAKDEKRAVSDYLRLVLEDTISQKLKQTKLKQTHY